jgi:hypothetical protein
MLIRKEIEKVETLGVKGINGLRVRWKEEV